MLDLRDLLLKIKEQKQMSANMSLEFDCEIETDNPTPLIKVINYFINYIAQLSNEAMTIQLNDQSDGILLSFSVFTDLQEMPALSDQLESTLQMYIADLEVKQKEGEYFQAFINFRHNEENAF